ncbi:protein PSY2 [Manihot esculenta]|uniref:Transmembrane protein n=1 Tax=Manihot esculenta TaxID=3983 RepID=A0A2C9VXU5_MANES|nr:protein PSY2 [Manihot esculenta]
MAQNLIKIKTLLLVSLLLLLLLLIPLSLGMVEGFREGKSQNRSLYKDGIQMSTISRKVLMDVLDYDDTGPNTRHDPRKKSGGKP